MLKIFFNIKFLLISLFILGILSLFIGVSDISISNLLQGDNLKVFLISRLPRLISILIVGASLAVCGVVLQQLSTNKFVSPSTSSITDWAKLGILTAILLKPTASPLTKTFISFIFAMFGAFVFINIIRKIKLKDAIFIPLIGIFLGSIISSITMFFAYQSNLIQNIESFMQGSFSLVLAGRYEILYLSIPALIAIYLYAQKWTLTTLGEQTATNLGLNYNFTVNLGLFLVSFITSLVVATIGILPFVGVIIPNIISFYLGDNLQKSLLFIAIFGALYLLICDILARIVIFPFEVPISLIAGIIGSFVFLYLLLRKQK